MTDINKELEKELQKELDLLQKEYEESPFDDLKVTFDLEKVIKGEAKVTIEAVRSVREALMHCIDIYNGDTEAEKIL